MFVRACPRPMHNVLCAGTIEARALWIRTRESGISLRRWRRLCHGGPPVVRNGPKDTDLTPVAPRYCSPGLPISLFTPVMTSYIGDQYGPIGGCNSSQGQTRSGP